MSSPAVAVRVREDTHTYTSGDGTVFWAGGFAPIYEDTDGEDHFVAVGEALDDPRLLYCRVAGGNYRPDALQDSRFDPGCGVRLQPEPDNRHDANAVAVWDATGSVQVGYIPADHSAEVASRIRAGEHLVGFVLREIRRGSQSGPRVSLHLLVMPAGELQMTIVEDD